MKIQKIKDNTSTLGLNDKKEFTIDTSNQMIVSILRDRLYSNKIGAVCREVASNSRDANREAGRENTPIKITIGNNNSLLEDEKVYVSFEDSGIGINPDRIENVFLKYGSSTKRDNNNQTGGFGIGAKTPFAYNNEFLIETVSDFQGSRKKHIYQAIILNEGGVESSQLILISEEETKEKTGTKIIVPIKLEDRQIFERELISATCFWDVTPEYVGFEHKTNGVTDGVPKINTFISGKNWSVVSMQKTSLVENLRGIKHNSFILIVDGIPYKSPVNYVVGAEAVCEATVNYHYESEYTHPLIRFETGTLTLSASREEVEVTDENKKIIEERIKEFQQEVLSKGEKKFNKLKTSLSKVDFLNRISQTSTSKEDAYFKSIKLSSNVNSLKDLPRSYSKLFETKTDNLHLIQNPEWEAIRCVKKNVLDNTWINVSDLHKWNIVYKSEHERMNYKKSETLRLENKPILFINVSSRILDHRGNESKTWGSLGTLKKGAKLLTYLKEEGIEIRNYRDIPETKVKRNSTYVKKSKEERQIKNVYARVKSTNNSWWNKETFKCNKVTGELLYEGEKEKTIFIKGKSFGELKELDKVNIAYKWIIPSEFVKEEYSDLLDTKELITLLSEILEFNVVVLKSQDYEALNLKEYKTANEVIANSLKEKELRSYLKAVIKDRHFDENTSLTEETDTYKVYSSKAGRLYLKLANFDIDKYKVITKAKAKNNTLDNPNLQNNKFKKLGYKKTKIVKSLADLIKDEFKLKDYSGYLTEDLLEEKNEEIKKTHPAIHYMFENILNDPYDWSFRDYDPKVLRDGERGLNHITKDAIKLLELALKNRK